MAIYNGTSGSDSINGTTGSDTLNGNAGNDTLMGGNGNDVLNGGVGNDTARYRGNYRDYDISWDAAARQYRIQDRIGGRDGFDLVSAVELFQFADTTRTLADLVAGAGDGQLMTGTAGNDSIIGGLGYDTLAGGAGNDTLNGGASGDLLQGGEGNDLLIGGAGDDVLEGGAGSDIARFSGIISDYQVSWDAQARQYTLVDRIAGRDGRDLASGVETFQFANGMRTIADLVAGTGDGLLLAGSSGNDTLVGGIGYDQLQGLDGNDLLDGQGANDLLQGGAGQDTLVGGAGNDTLDGGDGNYDLASFTGLRADYDISWDAVARQYTVRDMGGLRDGFDFVRGVEFFRFGSQTFSIADLLPGTGDGLVLTGTSGSDNYQGGVGYDYLAGGDGNDFLDGQDSRDTLEGGAGHDWLRGGRGDDSLDGGTGYFYDQAYFEGGSWEYDIHWDAANRYYVIADRVADRDGVDLVRNMESFSFMDRVAGIADLIPGATTGDGVLLMAHSGGDYLGGGLGFDTLLGGDGIDMLEGGAANDFMDGGGSGYDIVRYSGYSWEYQVRWDSVEWHYVVTDTVAGRDGTDTIKHVETLLFSDGERSMRSLVQGPSEGLEVTGTLGNDWLAGSADEDLLQGLYGDDVLRGGAANDVLDGGDGFDAAVLQGAAAEYGLRYDVLSGRLELTDSVAGRDGTDRLKSIENLYFTDGPRSVADWVPHLDESLAITGGAGNDSLVGGAGYDTLQGQGGDDELSGGDSDDLLDGGQGYDMLWGGAGADLFVLRGQFAGQGVDLVRDFEHGQDRLVLDRTALTTWPGGDLALGTLAEDAFELGSSASTAQTRVLYDAQAGALLYDPDGNGSDWALQIALVITGTGPANVSAGDILVI